MKISDGDKAGLFTLAILGMVGVALAIAACGIIYSVFIRPHL